MTKNTDNSTDKKTLFKYLVAGAIFVFLFGSLAHFVYDWTGKNFFVGFFFPVNESTWEHMKLVFFPMLVWWIIVKPKLSKNYDCFTPALFAGVLAGIMLIPILFYTYRGVLGFGIQAVDIGIFYVSVVAAFAFVYKITLSCRLQKHSQLLPTFIFLFFVMFILFTYLPPELGIFVSPV